MAKKKKYKDTQKAKDSAVARHADYLNRQIQTQAPFGKTFKTGGHGTGKRDQSRNNAKHSWKKEFA